MRFLTNSMLALAIAVSVVGCSGSTNSSDNSAATSSADNSAASSSSDNGAASSSSDNGAASSDNGSSGSSATTGDIPSYPGAATAAAGSTSGMSGMSSASGKVLTTADSFDKVYAWYQKNMPSGSEKSHTTSPIKSAVFTIGDTPDNMKSVTITTSGGKTMITIAAVKK